MRYATDGPNAPRAMRRANQKKGFLMPVVRFVLISGLSR